MVKILKLIQDDLANKDLDLASMVVPSDPVDPRATVVGVLDDELKRALGLETFYTRKFEVARQTALANKDREATVYGEARAEVDKYFALQTVANEMFWIALKEQFGLLGKTTVGIAEGYQVFYLDEEPRSCNCEACRDRAAGGFPSPDMSELGRGRIVIEVQSPDGFSAREPRLSGSEIPGLNIRGIELPEGSGIVFIEERASGPFSGFPFSLFRSERN